MTTAFTPPPPASAKRVHHEVRFGQYILGSTLGEGEFGKVKLGWRKDAKYPSQVAIKLIRRDTLVKDAELEVKIHREINSLKLLSHPNIVSLVEVMKSGKYIGIVLEYALGGELFDYILSHKFLKEPVAKRLFAQLISGVDYMHHKGLVHRDLKLENLLLDKHKNVIISDFGFVNAFGRDKADLMKTSCGLPCYAAPELVLSQSAYHGRRVDIWLLGVILYAMLLGYLPFDDDPENQNGDDIMRLYDYICRTPLTFPEYVLPLARDLLRRIIVPDPKKRIGMPQIRSHPWLSEHLPLLSVTAAEWDRAAHEKRIGVQPMPKPDRSKRYSMFDPHTGSLALLKLPVGSSIPQFAPRTAMTPGPALSCSSASIDNVYSATSTFSDNTRPNHVPRPISATIETHSSELLQWPAHEHRVDGLQTQASIALKSMYNDDSRVPKPVSAPPSARTSPYDTHLLITTIIESPVKASPKPNPLPMPTQNRFPTSSHRKPRPTSYHPLSISGTLMAQPGSPTFLEYIHVSGSAQMLSPSPPKALAVIEADVTPARSTSNSPTRHSRRNSLVTIVHASGVLSGSSSNSIVTSEPPSKRSSVLCYLEDKMDPADLADVQSSPQRSVSPQHRASTDGEIDPNLTIAFTGPQTGAIDPKIDTASTQPDAINTDHDVELPEPANGDNNANTIESVSALPKTANNQAEEGNTDKDSSVAAAGPDTNSSTGPHPICSPSLMSSTEIEGPVTSTLTTPTTPPTVAASPHTHGRRSESSPAEILHQKSDPHQASPFIEEGNESAQPTENPNIRLENAHGNNDSQTSLASDILTKELTTKSRDSTIVPREKLAIDSGAKPETKPVTRTDSFESLSQRIANDTSADLLRRRASKEVANTDHRRDTVSGTSRAGTGHAEPKKRNRFSIVSFYGNNSPAANSNKPSPAPNRRVLEPSNAANLPLPVTKQDPRTSMSSSRHSMSATSTSNATLQNGKEASAARKVMDFFRRKSVRM